MKKIKTIYLLGVFGIIIVFILVSLVSVLLPSRTETQKDNNETSQNLPEATPFDSRFLTIVSALPSMESDRTFEPAQPIEIVFNTPIDASKIRYSISPKVEVVVKNSSENTILIYPVNSWEEGVLSLKLLPQTVANNGATLNESFSYKMSVANPTSPPEPLGDDLRTY